MPLRPPAGFISANYDPLRNPDAPEAPEVTAGDAIVQARTRFPAGYNQGGSAPSTMTFVLSPSGASITTTAPTITPGSASPYTVLVTFAATNGTPYTVSAWALNTFGPGAYSAASGSVTPATPRAVFGSGETAAAYNNVIDYVEIATTGNATDFGDMYTNRTVNTASCASTSRCFWMAGNSLDGYGSPNNIIQYITFSTTGNSVDFGDTTKVSYSGAGCNSSTRGLYSVFYDEVATAASNIIDYITMASAGNSTDFGDLTVARYWGAACSSPTRGVFAGGEAASTSNVIDYVTIATTGNATDFGDLPAARSALAACSSSTRGLFGGGVGASLINYIQIATTGNATTFGNLSGNRSELSSCSSNTRGLWAGGTSTTNTIEYVTISTTSSVTDFGDLTVARRRLSAGCAANGGTQ